MALRATLAIARGLVVHLSICTWANSLVRCESDPWDCIYYGREEIVYYREYFEWLHGQCLRVPLYLFLKVINTMLTMHRRWKHLEILPTSFVNIYSVTFRVSTTKSYPNFLTVYNAMQSADYDKWSGQPSIPDHVLRYRYCQVWDPSHCHKTDRILQSSHKTATEKD